MCNIGLSSKKNMTFLEDLDLVPPTEFPPFIGDSLSRRACGFPFPEGENGLPPQGSSQTQGLPGYDCFQAGERGSGRRGVSPPNSAAGIESACPPPSDAHPPAAQITAIVNVQRLLYSSGK